MTPSAVVRASLATYGTRTMVIEMISVPTPGVSVPERAIASNTSGKAKTTSRTRMISWSPTPRTVARHHAEDKAERAREQRRHDPNHEGDSATPDEAGQHVASLLVGAKDVPRCSGWRKAHRIVGVIGRVRADEGRKSGRQRDCDEKAGGHNSRSITKESAKPPVAPGERQCLDGTRRRVRGRSHRSAPLSRGSSIALSRSITMLVRTKESAISRVVA